MELYMLNRQHRWMILESVENGPLLWPTVEENGLTRLKKYSELSTTEAIQADCEVKFEDQSLHVLGPSRLCAYAQLGDDPPFHKQAYMEYTQLLFCMLFGRPTERHLACPTRMHGSRLLSFQGYVLNHSLIPPPDHLFGGDT
nr:hypothetical protein [Tanacetum cinerariifolium]